MRTLALIFLISLFIIPACGPKKVVEKTEQSSESSPIDLSIPEMNGESDQPSDPEGLALIKGSDCTACHMSNQKLVGPSYKEVADKYKGNNESKDLLISSIVEGGSGVWGDIPMPGHPQLTKEEVALMVDYILSID